MIRRDFLKRCGLIATGVALTDPMAMASEMLGGTSPAEAADLAFDDGQIKANIRSLTPSTNKQITAVVIGAGNRGRPLL